MSNYFGLFIPFFGPQDNIIGLDLVAGVIAPTASEAMQIAKKAGHRAPIIGPLTEYDIKHRGLQNVRGNNRDD